MTCQHPTGSGASSSAQPRRFSCLYSLNLIYSNMIELIKGGDHLKLLVLLGFCLVAAISSTASLSGDLIEAEGDVGLTLPRTWPYIRDVLALRLGQLGIGANVAAVVTSSDWPAEQPR